jgi:hypothetical protein
MMNEKAIHEEKRNAFVKQLIKEVNDLAETIFGKKVELLPAKRTRVVYLDANTVERELQVVKLLQETIDRLLKVAYTKGFIDKEVKNQAIKVQATYDQYFLDYVKPLALAYEQIQKQDKKFEGKLQELSAETLGQEIADTYSTEFSKLKKNKDIQKRVDEIFKEVDTYGKLIDKQLELNIQAKDRSFDNIPMVAEVKLVELNKELAEQYQKQLNNTKKR